MTLSKSTKGARLRLPEIISTATARGAIEHTDEGEGMPLIALHGGMGGVDQSWLLARALLGDAVSLRVLALSRPGYLGTPIETGQTPDEQADAYAALMDNLGIDKAYIAGVSAGGPSAISFALRHEERCLGLVLVSTPTGQMPAEPRMLKRLDKMERMARIPGVVKVLGWAAARKPRKSGLRSVRDAALLDCTLADAEAGSLMIGLQNSVMHRLKHRIGGTRNDTRQLAMMDLPLHQLKVPILVVHGTEDRVVPFDFAEDIARKAASVSLLPISGGEHVALFTHLKEVRAAVRSFVRQ